MAAETKAAFYCETFLRLPDGVQNKYSGGALPLGEDIGDFFANMVAIAEPLGRNDRRKDGLTILIGTQRVIIKGLNGPGPTIASESIAA